MAATQAQITAMESALFSGELSVSYEGRSVTYRSVEQLQQALAAAKASIAINSSSKARRQVRVYMGDDKQ